jgi:hypothetical protein
VSHAPSLRGEIFMLSIYYLAGHQWLMLVILATQDAAIRWIAGSKPIWANRL